MTKDERKDIEETQRTTIDEAREEGIGKPEGGLEPTVPSYTDTGDVSDLGVEEPIVPRHLQGDSPPDPEEEVEGNPNQDREGCETAE